MKELLSPKQVAASIGVSESSLKRWCDQGVLATEKTPGGHRRVRISEVIRFLREQSHPLVRPEVLGLPVGSGRGSRSLANARESLLAALQEGLYDQTRRVIFDLYLSGASVVGIGEDVVAPTLQAIGEGWECGRIEVYQEHRACEVLNRVLFELRLLLPSPAPGAPVAVGGTPPGDDYRLATLLVELVLVDEGWNALSLGSSLPFETMAAAACHHRPELFWLSVSHVIQMDELRQGLEGFLRATPAAMPIVIGGQKSSVFSEIDSQERLHFGADLSELRRLCRRLRADRAAASV